MPAVCALRYVFICYFHQQFLVHKDNDQFIFVTSSVVREFWKRMKHETLFFFAIVFPAVLTKLLTADDSFSDSDIASSQEAGKV